DGLLGSGSTHFLACFRGVIAEHKKNSHNHPPFSLAIDGLLSWWSIKRSDCRTFYCYDTYTAILLSEHYDDSQYR
ncbi:MAG: hypothetical protein PVF71_12140, partial [Desulfobacterales bacterium]